MAEYYVGEIRMFSGNYAPENWALCNGQLLPITQNEVLFSVLGTTYGGDGKTNFALPDLRGRVPIGMGNTYQLGQASGVETVTLVESQLPAHTHTAQCAATGNATSPANAYWASNPQYTAYTTNAPNTEMSAAATGSVGGNGAHDNMMPFRAVSFIIALTGLYPSPN